MWGGVDVQEATTLGTFVWTADHLRGGNVGMQQPGKIAERQCDASRIVPLGCDCHATERSTVAREPNAGGEIVRASIAGRDFGFGVAASQLMVRIPEWLLAG